MSRSKVKSQPFTNCYSAIAYCDNAKIRYVVFSSLVLLKLADCLCLGLFFFFPDALVQGMEGYPKGWQCQWNHPPWSFGLYPATDSSNWQTSASASSRCLQNWRYVFSVMLLACQQQVVRGTEIQLFARELFFLKWRMYSTCLKWFFVGFFFCKGMNSLSWITNVAFSCRHWYCTSWPCGNWCSEARDGGYFCPCQCYNWSKICRDAPRSPERSSAWW